MLQCDIRQVIQGDGADDLETVGADFVHCIICGVPPRVIEVNDVHRRNTDRIQWRVVVDQFTAKIRKIISQVERFCRGEKIACHFCRRIRGKGNAKRAVANHIEQQATPKLLGAIALKLPRKIAAPIHAVRFGKLVESFFTIKKHQLNLARQTWMAPEHPGQFQEQARTRAAVVRSDKSNSVEHFRVVMRAQ